RGVDKVDHNRPPLQLEVDADRAVGEVHDDAAFPRAAAPEVDVAQSMTLLTRLRFGKMSSHAARASHRSGALQGDEEGLAVDLRVVAQGARQIEHEARAVASLDYVDAAQVAFGDVLAGASQRAARIGEIERDSRWVVDGETRRRVGRRLFHRHLDDDLAAGLRGNVNCLDGVRL